MPLQKDVLNLLERSVIHAKAEEENAIYLERLRALYRQPGNWSTLGEYNVAIDKMPLDMQKQLQQGQQIGSRGGQGIVRRIVYCGVPLAKKSLSQSYVELESIKKEVDIIAKLNNHRHIIKLVGTYESFEDGHRWLNILTYPVAACDLDKFLDDCQALRHHVHKVGGRRLSIGDLCDISIRSMALAFPHTASLEKTVDSISGRLYRIMGCITKAVKWIHSQDVQHRDLKPHNILLRPHTIYLTDFGISRSARNGTTQSYSGYTAGYAAPEVLAAGDVNPAQSDIYSLGCIFLHILTVLKRSPSTTATRENCADVLRGTDFNPERDVRLNEYMIHILCLPKSEQDVSPESEGSAKLITVEMILPLFSNERQNRPTIIAVDEMLWKAGGDNHIYHARCCHPASAEK